MALGVTGCMVMLAAWESLCQWLLILAEFRAGYEVGVILSSVALAVLVAYLFQDLFLAINSLRVCVVL